MKHTLIRAMPDRFTQQEWLDFYDLRGKLELQGNNRYLPETLEQFKKAYLDRMDPEAGYVLSLVLRQGSLNGWLSFQITGKGTTFEQVRMAFDYLGDSVPPDLIILLAGEINGYSSQHDSVTFGSAGKLNEQLAAAFKGVIKRNVNRYVLEIAKADIGSINEWLETIPGKNKDLRLEFHQIIPEIHLEEYCKLFTVLLKEMPPDPIADDYQVTPDEIRKAYEEDKQKNRIVYSYLLFAGDRQMVAMSNVAIDRNNPRSIYQFMTGVRRDYRGRQLGKWLKAAMYKKLVNDFPGLVEIRTDTNPINKFMDGINKDMGYEFKFSSRDYLVKKSDLNVFLTSDAVQ
ncbi:MAG: hypothetical protein RDU76_06570 [Candidatus Edwardsbacteria bacterium]|nr:hypothetical protein [Candidatus Edwardsbacteria bacterium]